MNRNVTSVNVGSNSVALVEKPFAKKTCRAVPVLKRKAKHIRKQISLGNMIHSPTVNMNDK